jgi:signal transduction histidine kinase
MSFFALRRSDGYSILQGMKEKHSVLTGLAMVALVCGVVAGLGLAQMTGYRIATLMVVICALYGRLLLCMFTPRDWCAVASGVVVLALAFVFFWSLAVPFAAVLLANIADHLDKRQVHLVWAGIATAALALITQVGFTTALITILAYMSAVYCDIALTHYVSEHQRALNERSQANRAQGLLVAQRKLLNEVQHDAAVEERNRIAARIHDEVGHGITGSIMTLEAALALWDEPGDPARERVQTTITNLRASVDHIRADLRSERTAGQSGGLAQVEALLATFQQQHNVQATLTCEGELAAVTPVVWVTLAQDLTETLTNVLKHAPAATAFTVRIAAKPYLLEAWFADNGNSAEKPVAPALATAPTGEPTAAPASMGLAAIRERTRLAGGQAEFRTTPKGFETHLVFRLL